ncbi:envelope stress response regulator transcription factor CpxR [Thorsellia anophelis]|uniref:Transcriptional regulatory protein CpxR n=1 Tax=Thorsellia anophelis DSM 18579 TaxID=1123402 RepID=A0A1H9YZ97_9GAMM|nr:envelope stress response regulator transcription factor CpxR [Thorsellia anophelis]SES74039.1 two-component system, OmpR family, response regulator CpxR [Thorsellia anophelis DSM 18579]
MNKILLVDDDRELTALLKQLLELDGFHVELANDGVEALAKLDDTIDLILLDIMMPNKNGLDALREIRQNYTLPIIMLTARGGELDRVLGLELGADDYLAKPFNDRELLARIRALLRRSAWMDGPFTEPVSSDDVSPVISIDGLVLYPGRQEARFDDKVLDLTGTEFTLLYLLAQNVGLVVSRDDLSMKVLGKPLSPFDRAVDMHVSNLRRKLPERKDGLPWFKTLRSRGYLMVAVG